MKLYHYNVIVSVFGNVATDIKEALYYYEGEEEGSRIIDNKKGDWGDIYPMSMFKIDGNPLPNKLRLRWVTPQDAKCYELETALDTAKLEELWLEQEAVSPDAPYKYLVVGMAPYGEVALWLRGNDKAVLFQQLTANEVEFNEEESQMYTRKVDKELMASLLSKEQYAGLMTQHQYRYVALEEYFDGKRWCRYAHDDGYYENIEVELVEDKRTDGTFDFTDNESLYHYHEAGMPQRVAVKWMEDGSNCFAHFWLDTHYVTWFIESFKEKYPETPFDLLIRMDVRSNRYQIAMTAEGLAPRAFVGTQYIVFKDGEEIARSNHFYKEDGEWRWE